MPEPSDNPVDVKQLLHSKWTAVDPVDREKHFLVTFVHRNADGLAEAVDLEAVLTKRVRILPWRDLRSSKTWRIGWQD